MKILRHILSHLFFIFFLVAIVSVFYYRTLLLPNDVVEKVDGIVTEIYPPALKFVSKRDYFWSIGGERIVSFDDLTIFEKNSEGVSSNKTENLTNNKTSVIVEEAVSDSQTKKEVPVVIAKVDEAEAIIKPIDKSVVKPEVVAVESVKEPLAEAPKVNNKIEQLPIVVKDSNISSERDLLIDARNAFNQGNINHSEKVYLELTQLDNDNPDIFGELGNVYYSQGKWDEAGQAYYEAAVRLITTRHYEQVAYLQRVISGLNKEHAEKLSQLMVSQ